MGAMLTCSWCNSQLVYGSTGYDLAFDWAKMPADKKTDIKFICVRDAKVGKSAFLQSYL